MEKEKKGYISISHCVHEFMFTILLGNECWHIVPHPSKEEEQELIIPLLEDIINKLNKAKVHVQNIH